MEQTGQALTEGLGSALGLSEPATNTPSAPHAFLRPPGALPEPDFTATCSACGRCVEACPAHCIVIKPGLAGGLPHIVPRVSPCVICQGLSCMKVCPTDALRLVDAPTQIHMGYARVDTARCLRTSLEAPPDSTDRDCRLCVEHCPIGESALRIGANGVLEVRPGCTGCGVCEHVCPTDPASISVLPLRHAHAPGSPGTPGSPGPLCTLPTAVGQPPSTP